MNEIKRIIACKKVKSLKYHWHTKTNLRNKMNFASNFNNFQRKYLESLCQTGVTFCRKYQMKKKKKKFSGNEKLFESLGKMWVSYRAYQ